MPYPGASGVTVRPVSVSEFYSMRAEWDALVRESGADPLFMGWAWMSSWWETWGQRLELQLNLLAVECNQRLVALAPLYRHSRRTRWGWSLERVHLIGNAWHLAPTVRSEYMDLIALSEYRAPAMEAVFKALGRRWDELVICDLVDVNRDDCEILKSLGLYAVERRADSGVRIDTQQRFTEWLAKLGPNTRRKVYNRRALLASKAEVHFDASPTESLQDLFDCLNRFHGQRWGGPCFSGPSLDFHFQLLDKLPKPNAPVFSCLRIDGQIRSILYDITIGQTVYNLQSGYEEHYARKLALGTLHLGYAIERACQTEGIHAYDLLAGGGKNSLYKLNFAGEITSFRTIQIVRHPLLIVMYRTYMALPETVRKPVWKWLAQRTGPV